MNIDRQATRHEYMKQRYDRGTCKDCSNAHPPGRALCDACLRLYARRTARLREERKAAGVCLKCKKTPVVACGLCETCWFKDRAGDVTGHQRDWQELQKLFYAQGGRCVYTGEVLSIGNGASVDHIKPRSRHPELVMDLNNLQWVSGRVNRAKADAAEQDFLLLVKSIYEYRNLGMVND